MSLEQKIMADIKVAMIAKDSLKLEVLRAIKSAILLVKTDKQSSNLDEDKEVQILQKLLKQRKESCEIYLKQDRSDLASHEKNQASIISKYLPTPYSNSELQDLVNNIMKENNLYTKSDMGKLISLVMKNVKGRADGKSVSEVVKQKLL
ncbi:MAG: glutamyl-tRNA amidotransferase [Flavobacteriales bacterium]|nr:glutamyl-tRNA amidotransferase [Flavobacteriales bacterium]|tara:strand:+ start:1532 stop:1978 length:447 start_codon:yes stop_codon:yes gene_type:complete